MGQMKNQSEAQERKQESVDREEIGGREFGQVIEPTQGQMASGNKGLTADVGKEKESGKKKSEAA